MTDTFWALIALVLFLAILAYLKVPSWIGKALDARSLRISEELEDARRLREDAQQLLAEYQRKRSEAEKEAADIIAVAQREAVALTEDARRKTEEYVERRNRLAEQKISLAEADAIAAVRSKAVDIAIAAAGKIISEELDSNKSDKLFHNSLEQVKTKLN
ncbi:MULTISPECIES: F0F1 ATP synthase subunit B [unclassified Bartonella]|uniref:F0F1 ATP synthase subunit B n=1 Tax=unclassified Bartonella TaxID=2645622 RepID=UPI0015FD6F47|nr:MULTISPECIES: F0F1 ATP synthase subunit B [unclassified Bartonella]UXN04358.1 F0F1 ATP synthase subunit B [Bartonella sp. HY406]UXN07352.1 F0F1 ATP synthase subunit B [Bartonella sp. HY761]